MSKDVKIILLVIASLAGLVLVAFVAVTAIVGFTISRQVANSTPASEAADAAKIAHFTLPSGYRYLMASNLMFMNLVEIVPDASRNRQAFFIQLQGVSIPAGGSTNEQSFEASMRRGLGAGSNCENPQSERSETLRTQSGHEVNLDIVQCGGTGDREFAYGRIPSVYPVAFVAASGSKNTFDLAALRSLVTSIR